MFLIFKSVLEPFSKVLSYCVQNTTLKYKVLSDLCTLSSRAFSKERDKHQLCRQLVFELVQALKFKTNLPDSNLLLLVGFVLQDAGGLLPPDIVEGLPEFPPLYTTNASDCTRQYLNDILDFLADFHTLAKIKNFKTGSVLPGLSEDTLGGALKAAIAQYLSLEMSRGNTKDQKTVARYLPWLYNAPSSLQQGPKEYTECVGHMRLLSWLLVGALTHTALLTHKSGTIGQHGASVHYHLQHPGHTVAQPVPQEASCHIADHIQVRNHMKHFHFNSNLNDVILGYLCWIQRFIQDVRRSYVVAVPRVHIMPTVDRLFGATVLHLGSDIGIPQHYYGHFV